MVPKELKYYSPFANGNVATCSFQGFLNLVGSNCVAVYNSSICFYYLAIVKYNKKDAYIKTKLEPWFHAVAGVVPMAIGISLLFLKAYNSAGPVCGPYPYNPPHCSGYEKGDTREGFTIPCGRGDWTREMQGYSDVVKGILWLCAAGFPILLTPFVIIITNFMMYRSLLKVEKKIQRYGAKSLYLISQRGAPKKNTYEENNGKNGNSYALNNASNDNRGTNEERFGRSLIPWGRAKNKKALSKSNRAKTQKRSIVYMAFSYALAWAFTWLPFFINHLLGNNTARIVSSIITPLQGLFNLIVYMSPKVRNTKSSKRAKLTWRQAMLKAWKSKGEKRREITATRGTNGNRKKKWKQWMKRIIKEPAEP